MTSTNANSFPNGNQNEMLLQLIREKKHCDEIEKALKAPEVNVNHENIAGETALRLAVVNASEDIIKVLLEKMHKIDINYQNKCQNETKGDTALHLAVEMGNKKMVALLLENFAHSNIPNAKGMTAMDLVNNRLQNSLNDVNLVQIKGLLNTYESYYAEGLQQSLHGNMFQVKLFMVTHMRATKNGFSPFRLSSDWNAAGTFDDICYEQNEKTDSIKKKFQFFQARHKLCVEKNEIDIYELFFHKDFNIIKYFESYIGVKNFERFENGHLEFSIVTNTRFEQTLLNRPPIIIQTENFTKNEVIYFDSTNFKAKKYKLCDSDEELSNHMKLNLIDCALKSRHFGNFDDDKTYLELKRNVISCKVELKKIQYAREAFRPISSYKLFLLNRRKWS